MRTPFAMLPLYHPQHQQRLELLLCLFLWWWRRRREWRLLLLLLSAVAHLLSLPPQPPAAVAQMLRLFLLSLLLLPLQLPMISVCILSNARRVDCIQFDFPRRLIAFVHALSLSPPISFPCFFLWFCLRVCCTRTITVVVAAHVRRNVCAYGDDNVHTTIHSTSTSSPTLVCVCVCTVGPRLDSYFMCASVAGCCSSLFYYCLLAVDDGDERFWIYCQMIYLKFVLNVIFCRRLRSDRLLNIHYERAVRFNRCGLVHWTFFFHKWNALGRTESAVNLFHYSRCDCFFFFFAFFRYSAFVVAIRASRYCCRQMYFEPNCRKKWHEKKFYWIRIEFICTKLIEKWSTIMQLNVARKCSPTLMPWTIASCANTKLI